MKQAGLLGVSRRQTLRGGQTVSYPWVKAPVGRSPRCVCLSSNFCLFVPCHTRPGAGLTQAQLPGLSANRRMPRLPRVRCLDRCKTR